MQTLLPFQLEAMRNTRLNAGLPRLLTESPIGNKLELTEEQRRNIQRNSEELAKDIERFIHETRQRAFDLVGKELTSEQKEQLFELYNRDQIVRLYATARLYSLFTQHKFELPEDRTMHQRVFQSSVNRILSMELDDEAWHRE